MGVAQRIFKDSENTLYDAIILDTFVQTQKMDNTKSKP